MRELLAVPTWDAPPAPLDAWKAALAAPGHPVEVRREDGETWLEVNAVRLRGYVVLEGEGVAAINFELHAADPADAEALLAEAAAGLGWELHDDDGADDDDEDDEP